MTDETVPMSDTSESRELLDEQRRNAITEWWAQQALRDFIARKRAALRTKANGGEG